MPTTITYRDVMFALAVILLLLGILCFGFGVFVLVARAMGKDTDVIAAQTSRIAQKGVTEDMSGLVGNASALIEAMQSLVRTAAGIGMFLVGIGISLMSASYYLFTTQISWNV